MRLVLARFELKKWSKEEMTCSDIHSNVQEAKGTKKIRKLGKKKSNS